MNSQSYLSYIDEKKDIITDVSDKIWSYAELSLKEYKSSALLAKTLREEGFEVHYPFDNIETAFMASFGEGKPVIGILAEFDALSGLSQKGGLPYKEEEVPGGTGHGCGHNLLGAGSLAAALGIKKYLEEKGRGSGTVKIFGCPGEEGVATKAWMARDNVFSDCDAALTWHPTECNQVVSGTCTTCLQSEYKFTGIASHAAGYPEKGRSALDAVELMNVGIQFLREHMPSTARIHYSITDAGGDSPNVVQPHAKALYMVRDIWVKDALDLQKRVDKIAEGAALMTETTVEKTFVDACSNTVPNKTLEELYYKNFKEIPLPTYTEEEISYAKKLYDSVSMKGGLPGDGTKVSDEIADYVDEVSHHGTVPINNFLIPHIHHMNAMMGSTDVGDVSWCVPTAQINTACFAASSPGHSWQNVSCGKTSIAHKGLILAAKIMAKTAVDLIENPDILKKAQEEHRKITEKYGGYICPIPEGVAPKAPQDI